MHIINQSSQIIEHFIIMLADFICSFYIFYKTSKSRYNIPQKLFIVFGAVFIVCTCTFLYAAKTNFDKIIYIVLFILLILLLDKKRYYINIPTITISIGITYGIEILSVFIISLLFNLSGNYISTWISDFVTAVLQVFFTILLLRIKRIKNGFSFFENRKNFGIGLFISGPILILFCINKEAFSLETIIVLLFGSILSLIGLILWIRSAITKHYRKRLKLRAEEYSKTELAEKSKEIEKLTSENTSLSSIIHLDNHIIQSIETELNKLNNSELTNKLLISITQRNEYVNDTLIKSKNLPSTGSVDIDAVLTDLYIKASSRGIDYNLNVDCDINYLINNLFSKDYFEILLRKTITNAIVSVENNPDSPGRILINISQPNDIYELTVMDNGVFIDNNSIPDIVEKSNASFLINKFDNNDSFTKSLTIIFDGLKNNTEL